MINIAEISTSDLEKDLRESNEDIAACETALALGIMSYSGGSVKGRLEDNKEIVKVITAELLRRQSLNIKN